MHSTLQHGLEGLHLSMAEQEHIWQRMHFATDSVPESKTWIPRLLREWKSPRKVITASVQPGTTPACRFLLPRCYRSASRQVQDRHDKTLHVQQVTGEIN